MVFFVVVVVVVVVVGFGRWSGPVNGFGCTRNMSGAMLCLCIFQQFWQWCEKTLEKRKGGQLI